MDTPVSFLYQRKLNQNGWVHVNEWNKYSKTGLILHEGTQLLHTGPHTNTPIWVENEASKA